MLITSSSTFFFYYRIRQVEGHRLASLLASTKRSSDLFCAASTTTNDGSDFKGRHSYLLDSALKSARAYRFCACLVLVSRTDLYPLGPPIQAPALQEPQ